jgi:hypothetical protein
MAVFSIFAGGALTRRMLEKFSLGGRGSPGWAKVVGEVFQTIGPGVVLGVGVYVAARVGWSFARQGDRRSLLAGFATAALVALAFARITSSSS